MAKKRLTSQFLNSNLSPGKYYDDSGTGLFINVGKSGTKGWGQKIRFSGKQQELGLGKYPYVSLAEARRLASENQALKAQGVNPKSQKTKVSAAPTFAELAEEFIPIKQKSLSNAKHREQWRSTIIRTVLYIIYGFSYLPFTHRYTLNVLLLFLSLTANGRAT